MSILDKIVQDFKDIPQRYPFLSFLKKKNQPSSSGTRNNIKIKPAQADKTLTSVKVANAEKPKRKISPLGMAAIIGLLLVLLIDDEPTEPPTPATPEVAKTETPAKVEPTPEPPTATESEVPATEEPVPEVSETSPVEPTAPVADTNMEQPSTTEPTVTDSPPATEPAAPSVEPTLENLPIEDKPVIDLAKPEGVVTEPTITELPNVDLTAPPKTEEPADTATTSAVESKPSEDIVDTSVPTNAETGSVFEAKPKEDVSEQILADLEKQLKERATKDEPATNYLNPPEYDYAGRGLVYNCKGKHWACIDGPSFKTCEGNYAYLKSQKRSKECFPVSVFETNRACQFIQRKKVSTNSETSFCQ